MKSRLTSLLALVACAILSPCAARADVKLPAIFGDHMVLQRAAKIPVWGTADAGEKVTVKVAGQQQSATADDKGKWRVELAAIDAKEPVEFTVTGAKDTVTFKDVLVGEVWLCSGQSNMGFTLQRAANGAEAVKAANRPTMRLFTVGREIAPDKPREEMKGKWELCTPDTVKGFTAVGYFFGAELQDKLNTPVGLIHSSWGGTRAEAWIPRPTFDALKLPYEPQWTEEWLHPKQVPGVKKQEPARPHEAPSCLWNGMVAPFAGYAMRGVVWYQGETNTAYAEKYRDVLGALVASWRDAWHQGDFPFLVVQLPNFIGKGRDWPALRDGQAQVARDLPNVGLAITIDVGNPNDIHPTEKLIVGKRLALVAGHLAYGKDVPYSGPAPKSVKANGGEATIEFDHVNGGLVAKGGSLQGFEIAGDDGKFVPATAKIDGDRAVVHAEGVAAPKSVRYAWSNDPRCNLYNRAELPAAPFQVKAE